MNTKQIIKILESEGWGFKRINGSHQIMGKNGKIVPVPVHGTTDLAKGLVTKIEKQTGVKLQ
ncbi:type II toxin-antitoxin system HicA family toxin [Nitrosomonas communis]|uniref:Predicted RNA binding protein YcfA, dsRBD-like fold, HicA-like mRNA interferase family n=1 Tax=Nitrosomonas communis TaxID=44574 RepID=A0A1I4TWF1_9PROT|nr:type II toxin-antitoxin system HicA family toxin [Nitrosomonas communis]SFM80945.1 Predicted RNA binding protein YcfA, dsRBD-like fold, HicA-like mRNA interferase family [Nitrosomonas communis]